MTKEEILEGNKLIAVFMGYQYYPLPEDRSYNPGWWVKDKQKTINKISHTYLCRSHNDLKYHNSMDWLLPVIDKIKNDEEFSIIGGNGDPWEVEIETTGYHYITQAYCKSINLIEACWVVCVHYIENFNVGTLRVAKK